MVLDFMESFWPHYMLLLAFGKNTTFKSTGYCKLQQKLTENSNGVILKGEINQQKKDFGFIVQ